MFVILCRVSGSEPDPEGAAKLQTVLESFEILGE